MTVYNYNTDVLGQLPELPAPNVPPVFGFTSADMRVYAAQAVVEERERCAKLCMTTPWPVWGDTTEDLRDALVDAIRGEGVEIYKRDWIRSI